MLDPEKVKELLELVKVRLQPEEEFCLDDLVQDTTDCIATKVNNMGFEAQIFYLLMQGVEPSHIFNVMGVPEEE